MSEIIEQSQSNTYIQVSIDDNINNQHNKINYDDDFINSIPDADVFITIVNSICSFVNLPKQSLQLAIFGIGNIVITKDYNDPLKLSINLFNMTTDAFIQSISLGLQYTANGTKALKILSRENLLTFLTTYAVEQLVHEVVTYECISSLYKLKYETAIDNAKRERYLTINAGNKSISDIKNFLHYTGVLNDNEIERIYVQTNDG